MKDENTVRYPQDAPRKRQRRKDSVPHFKIGPPITVRALALWEQTLAATLAEAHPIRFTASVTGTKADDKEGISSIGIQRRHSPRWCRKIHSCNDYGLNARGLTVTQAM